MSTPTGSFDTLDALDAAAPAPEPPALPPAEAPTITTPATSIVWGNQGEPAAACPAMYITADDAIQLTIWNSNAALTTLTVQLRILRPDGGVQIEAHTINNIPATRAAFSTIFAEAEGLILGATVGPPGVAVVRGQTYIQLAVFRGQPTSPTMQQVLLSDYVTSAFQPSWPGGRVLSSVEGAGYIHTVQSALPGQGVSPNLFVPAHARWRLLGITVGLATSVQAGNRQVGLILNGGSALAYETIVSTLQGPSLGYQYSFAPGVPIIAVPPAPIVYPIPLDLVLDAGGAININSTGLQTLDQYSTLNAQIEEWIDA